MIEKNSLKNPNVLELQKVLYIVKIKYSLYGIHLYNLFFIILVSRNLQFSKVSVKFKQLLEKSRTIVQNNLSYKI